MGREGAGSPLFRPEGFQVLTLWVRGEDGDAGLKRTEALVRPKEPWVAACGLEGAGECQNLGTVAHPSARVAEAGGLPRVRGHGVRATDA